MAQDMPDALQLREAKYGAKSQSASQSALAHDMVADGRVAEALDLFLIAGDAEGATGVRKMAVEQGRPVWLLMMERDGTAISAAEWKQCGEVAEQAGRLREAYRAFGRAGDEAAQARIHESLPGYEIYVPAGK